MNSDEIRNCLSGVLEAIPDPRISLADEVLHFVYQVTPMINVDLLIQDENRRTLLSWRDDQYGSGWHIPGGIVRYRETLERRIAEVARIELGATVEAEPKPCEVTQFNEGPRGHFISLLYRCKLTSPVASELLFQGGEPKRDELGWIQGVPDDILEVHRRYERWLRGS